MFNAVVSRRVPLAIVLILALVLPIWILDFRPSDASLIEGPMMVERSLPVEVLEMTEPAEPIETGPIAVEKKLHIGSGDTLMGLMLDAGVPRIDAHNSIVALRKHYDPRGLRPEHDIILGFERARDDAEQETFTSLTIRPNLIKEYAVQRGEDGAFAASKTEKAVVRKLVRAEGTINSSLYVAAVKAGVPPAVLMELVRIYSWDVDFQRSIRPDDRFDVMYERYYTEDGALVREGDILYANLVLQDDANPLYRYTMSDKTVDYFDDKGKSARKALMRTPINGARLSSGYGVRRHPILGYNKMHRGVDFAAPRGTPIYAAGDGTIVYRGRNGAYGNYVRIRHNSEYSTAYAHMSKFARKAQKGSRVRQGQVIGYVGTTGRSTGAHLHYEILRRGRQANPMRVKMPSGRSLKGTELARFEAVRTTIDQKYAELPMITKVAENN